MAAFKRRAAAPPQTETGGDAEAELPINESGAMFQTDGTRTAQYMKYIRALNTQFTSWVQQQLKEHPFELWQEGIQDYLKHASKIQDDFRDVTTTYAHTNTDVQSKTFSRPQNIVPNLGDGSISSGFGKSIFEAKESTSFNQPFPSSLSVPVSNSVPSGLPFLNIPAPGSASLSFPPNNGTDTQEDDDAVPEPSSPSVKRSEEPGIKVLHEIKCKLYIKGDQTTDTAWKEMGMGNLTLRSREGVDKGTKDARATLLVRNEVGRILLNALLYPNMKMNIQKNTVTGIFHSAETDVKIQGEVNQETDAAKARLYLFKLKTVSDAEQLVEVLTSNAPRGE